MRDAPPFERRPGIVEGKAYAGDLRALLEAMRSALQVRGEGLPSDWADSAFTEIQAGRMLAWVWEGEGPLRGLAILSVSRDRGFGQVHVLGPPSHVGEAMQFVREVDRARPPGLRRMDFGTSADPRETEQAWGARLEAPERDRRYEVILRRAMVRSLDAEVPPAEPTLPLGFRFAGAVPLGAAELAKVDYEAFAGGPDAGMVAETPEDNERLLTGLLQGDLGTPVREASPAILQETERRPDGSTGTRLVGFALHLQESSSDALLADIAILPEFQGRGFGGALLARGLRGLLAMGFRRSRLWVTETNAPARALYGRTGYQLERVGHILRWGPAPRPGTGTDRPGDRV